VSPTSRQAATTASDSLCLVLALLALLVACGGAPRSQAADEQSPCHAPCVGPGIDATLYLIGDAGDAVEPEPVLEVLARDAMRRSRELGPERTAVAFLGDNLYPSGLPEPGGEGWEAARHRLEAELAVVREARARGFFVPGNHDWAHGGRDGWRAIQRLGSLLTEWRPGRASLHPAGGCPGPDPVDLGDSLRLVFLDTQWWLHRGPKPSHPSSSCGTDSEMEVVAALRTLLRNAEGRQLVALGHHPLRSGGPHGGYLPWPAHLFPLRDLQERLWIPLPGLGSLAVLARRLGVSNQDVGGPRNRRLRRALAEAFEAAPPLVYASGHDHNLQLIEGEPLPYLVVSGAGNAGNLTPVRPIDGTLVAQSAPGYVRLEALEDGRVRLVMLGLDARGAPFELFNACLDSDCGAEPGPG
jgi:hypothetical protein